MPKPTIEFDNRELLERSPLGIVLSDIDERVFWCNQQFLNHTQLTEEQVIGHLYPSLPIEAIDKQSQVVQLFAKGLDNDIKFQYWQADLSNPSGGKAHYFTRDRQTRKKFALAAKLESGKLPQRASWVEFLNYEVSRSRRYNNPLSTLKLHLVVLDKPDNVAEETLHSTIKDTLMDELRWADMIGHTDHGTYLMILPETPGESLPLLQEKLSKALKRQFDFISEAMNYRLVYGEASWRKHDDSHMLLKRARDNLVEKLEALLNEANA